MYGQLRDILDYKGKTVHTVSPDDTVSDAVDNMTRAGVGAVLVVAEGHPVGIFTERDLLKRVVGKRQDPRKTVIADVMTREVVAVDPDVSVEDAMAVVTDKRCRHLPVMENGDLAGMISIGDLTRWVNKDREVQIQQLVNFITGRYPA